MWNENLSGATGRILIWAIVCGNFLWLTQTISIKIKIVHYINYNMRIRGAINQRFNFNKHIRPCETSYVFLFVTFNSPPWTLPENPKINKINVRHNSWQKGYAHTSRKLRNVSNLGYKIINSFICPQLVYPQNLLCAYKPKYIIVNNSLSTLLSIYLLSYGPSTKSNYIRLTLLSTLRRSSQVRERTLRIW